MPAINVSNQQQLIQFYMTRTSKQIASVLPIVGPAKNDTCYINLENWCSTEMVKRGQGNGRETKIEYVPVLISHRRRQDVSLD